MVDSSYRQIRMEKTVMAHNGRPRHCRGARIAGLAPRIETRRTARRDEP
jgi:hypothetical protein